MSSFLDLPLELRYQVYSYTAIPTSTYFFTFHGLYLSCHQVRNEMGPECGSILQKHLDHLEHSLPVGTIKFDPSAFGKQHVQMSLSSLFTGEKFNKPNPGFMQVCQMHLAHIQLELPPQDFLFVNTMAAISFLGGLARRKIVKASCITFEIPEMNERMTERCRDHGIAETENDLSSGHELKFWWYKNLKGKVTVMWKTK